MARLALRFISGKYKGGEYVLPERREIYIGRSSEIDLVLMEDMVSRKHARIWFQDTKIFIEDLGSTNGTFVNGEKITKAEVKQGDRILIGTSIMKVVEVDETSQKAQPGAQPQAAKQASGMARSTMHGGRSMTGTISEVPLPDLIQLFSTSKKTGTLIVNKDGVVGRIHLETGQLVFASMADALALDPLKVIFRILSWDDGTFELMGPEPFAKERSINMPTEHILMEGLRQLDELRHMQKNLPALDSELVVVTPLAAKLSALSSADLDIFQLVYNYGTLQAVLDRASVSDLEAATILLRLLKESYVAQI
ncbi:MAG: DUF4388 domain-containing protein [Myxococcota bacterium]|jgi:pSer/pThr/pTyr-binding forkhead associated (FHA) protein|nr:DUF4388 domain-containing protein [Myxococcota bacterium]